MKIRNKIVSWNSPFYLSNFVVSFTAIECFVIRLFTEKNTPYDKPVQTDSVDRDVAGRCEKSVLAGEPPRLIIFISVDQMREDYFDRFAPYFTGGFKQLYTEGIFFANANLNYASSVTCLGHATLSTGTYPMKSGIVDNEWINPATRKSVYCVEDTAAGSVDDEGGGSSPNNLLTTGVGDWLKASSPLSKVIAASGKDRAAILMGENIPITHFGTAGGTATW